MEGVREETEWVKGDGRYGGGCGMWKLVVVSSTPLTQQVTFFRSALYSCAPNYGTKCHHLDTVN